MSPLIKGLEFLTTTKVPISVLNEVVRDVEEALEKGQGDILICIRNKEIFKVEKTIPRYFVDEKDADRKSDCGKPY